MHMFLQQGTAHVVHVWLIDSTATIHYSLQFVCYIHFDHTLVPPNDIPW